MTSRRFPALQKSNSKDSGGWKEVRIIDADQLEAWLDQCPAVAAWFGNIMGAISPGLRSVDEAWSKFSAFSKHDLNFGLVLNSRDKEKSALIESVAVP